MLGRIARNSLFVLLTLLLYVIVFTSSFTLRVEETIANYIPITFTSYVNLGSFVAQVIVLLVIVIALKLFVLLCFLLKNEFYNFGLFIIFIFLIYLSGSVSNAFNISLPLVSTTLLLFIFYLFMVVYKTSNISKEKQFVRKLFARYVNPDLLNNLVKDPSLLEIKGENKELTIMFSDIRGFTKMSEKIPTEDTFNLLNEYLNRMTKILKKHKATIDKYIGDAIMAFWNAPVDDDEKELNAILSGLDMIDELEKFNNNIPNGPLNIGIGINTGKVLVGNVGSTSRIDYTIIGDEVNLASRIEGLTKKYGVNLLVSFSTIARVADNEKICFRQIDEVIVKGKKTPVRIFQPMHNTEENQKLVAIYSKGYHFYRSLNFREAVKYFNEIEHDIPSRIMKDRILRNKDLLIARNCVWIWDEK